MNIKKLEEIKTSVPMLKSYIVSGIVPYKKFLNVCSNTYGYSFENQLMIFKYKPYASFCATFDDWTKLYDRHINNRSKGIPILINEKLEYVFDVTNTTKRYPHQNDEPDRWQLTADNIGEVNAALNADISSLDEIVRLIEIRTSGMSFENAAVEELVRISSAYVISKRCEIDNDQLLGDNVAQLLKECRSFVSNVGIAVNDICGSILKSIEDSLAADNERTVETYEREDDERGQTRADTRNERMAGGYDIFGRRNISARREGGEVSVLPVLNAEDKIGGHNTRNETGIHGRSERGGIEHSGETQRRSQNGLGNESYAASDEKSVSQRRGSLAARQDSDPAGQIRSAGSQPYESSRKGTIRGTERDAGTGNISRETGRHLSPANRILDEVDNGTGRSERRFAGEGLGAIRSSGEHEQITGRRDSVERNDLQLNNTVTAGTTAPAVTFYRGSKDIIGTANYRYIKAKRYRKYNTQVALQIAEAFEKHGIFYSGRIDGDMTTLTFSNDDMLRCKAIISEFEFVSENTLQIDEPILSESARSIFNATSNIPDEIREKAKKSLIVNLYGGPGAGKSTAALQLVAELKKRGYHAEYVSEVAKDLVYAKAFDILDGSEINQRKILEEQKNRLDMAAGNVDVAVTDSPLLLNMVYLKEQNNDYFAEVLSQYNEYNNFNILISRDTSVPFEVEGRIHNLEESIAKDQEIIGLLENNHIIFENFDRDDISKVADVVLKQLEVAPTEKTFAEQVDDVLAGKANRYNDLKVCDTPQILLDVGCEQLPMFYTQRHLRKVILPKNLVKHTHGLTEEQIKKLPDLLAKPVMIYDSLSRHDSLVVVTSEVDTENDPIIISIHPNGSGKYDLERVSSNFITSVYGRENFEKHLELEVQADNVLYINKEKSQELFSVLRLQFSQGLNNLDFNTIIHQSRNIVKSEKSFAEQENESLSKTPDLRAAFEKLYANHNFSDQAKQLLERAEKQMKINSYDNLNPKLFRLPIFTTTYGSLSRINKLLFDGKLKDIIAEINGYIGNNSQSELHAEISSDDVEIDNDKTSEHDENTIVKSQKAEYMLLSRLKQDCDYYLGNGGRNARHLWAATPEKQIQKMKELHSTLVVKPEWLSEDDILNYEKEMIPTEKEHEKTDALSFAWGDGDWFSESDILSNFAEENPEISFALANAVFEYLDKKQHTERNIEELNAGWYKKTNFTVSAVINGEHFKYEGRFDIGDGKGAGGGSLIDHIRTYNEEMLHYTQYPFNQPEYKERAQHFLDVFIPFLETHSELTAEEQRILDDFKKQYTIRTVDDVEKPEKAELEDNGTVSLRKVGDFYEMYGKNAEIGEKVLGLRMLSKNGQPMVGFPAHVKDEYSAKLKEAGYSVLNEETPVVETADIDKPLFTDEAVIDEIQHNEKSDIPFWEMPEVQGEQLSLFGAPEPLTEPKPEKEKPKHEFASGPIVDGVQVYEALAAEIKRGTGFVGGKIRVKDYIDNAAPTLDELAKFLKKEYGIGGHSGTGNIFCVNSDAKGLTFNFRNGEKFRHSWYNVAVMVEANYQAGSYITDNEINEYNKTQHQETSEVLQAAEQSDFLEKKDYHITKSNERYGEKTTFRNNIAAIRLLKQIESEGRNADEQEQDVLAKYVGWGGLPQAFSPDNEKWHNEYIELKNVLNDKEYRAAASSTLSAFYTDHSIISAVYDHIKDMGFTGGKILEPSVGIGNFLGSMPIEMYEQSEISAVELDSITGRIAKLLYPSAKVEINGFEETSFSDNYFDVAVGNVPFGSFTVFDAAYDKHKFMLHDYFFAKSIDKVRAGGIIAFITSTGTMDKQNADVRKYIDERAEFLGAVRLPSSAFATTEASADIIFLKKREHPVYAKSVWTETVRTPEGFTLNKYFYDHTNMVLGKRVVNKMYGRADSAMYVPFEGNPDISDLLREALKNVKGSYDAAKEIIDIEEVEHIKAPDELKDTRNYSYVRYNNKLWFYRDEQLEEVSVTNREEMRLNKLISIRDDLRQLISMQLDENVSDEHLIQQREELSDDYDDFVTHFGYINSRSNQKAFRDDNSIVLLSSLEVFKDDKFVRKADIFYRRTISPHHAVARADTAYDALIISMSLKARVDIDFMSELCDKPYDEIIKALKSSIYPNPEKFDGQGRVIYEPADEYLSGNIREKLAAAEKAAADDPMYEQNVSALREAMPEPVKAADIEVRLGATWIKPKYIRQFIYELLLTPPAYQLSDNIPERWKSNRINVFYSEYTGRWNVLNKTFDSDNVRANSVYGTKRRSAYDIIERTLNLSDIKVYDTITDVNGKDKKVLNKPDTIEVQQKQVLIEQEFKNWIYKDQERRNDIVATYNRLFNSIRPREYDGSYLEFAGMNPEITLKKHQKDAIAHGLFGGNELLAHVVGAGKTFEMAAIAMEGKRLGLHSKSLMVVPNHITEQFADDFMQLYPGANLLVAKEVDFQAKNRRALFAKIATGDYDAIIIGHSQLASIPMSVGRQQAFLARQIDDISMGLQEIKEANGERFQIKQMERTKKFLEKQLKELTEKVKHDDIVTFEEMGIDKMFIDEAHQFKNLYLHTKMNNVAGLSSKGANKTEDLYMKCDYLNEKTNNRGLVFATGTPLTKSITEIYTMQRYLQPDYLKKSGLYHFDAWASTFGETVTATELAPEGTGYRMKTRFSRFYNLPELMASFKTVADIKTADVLKLPVPKCNIHNVSAEATRTQKKLIEDLSRRASMIHSGAVSSDEDNMLVITNDGRKIGLDQRLIDPKYEDDPESKVNMCVDNVYSIWEDNADKRSTQLIFCDFSTPSGVQRFNVYDDIRSKLLSKGVPAEEIAFIHDYNSEVQKKNLFEKVRNGEVRILLGSTTKMGAGTNVQNKLIAIHDLDAPWNPSDLEQRLGRMVRRGNENDEVDLYRYVTKDTFDAYLFQMLENKQRPISQIMSSKSSMRSCQDIDETVLNYAEVKALCAGNPLIKEKMELDIDIAKLQSLKSSYMNNIYRLQDDLLNKFPKETAYWKSKIESLKADIELSEKYPIHKDTDDKRILTDLTVNGERINDKGEAVEILNKSIENALRNPDCKNIAFYRGFNISAEYSAVRNRDELIMKGNGTYHIDIDVLSSGTITRMDNVIKNLSNDLLNARKKLGIAETNLQEAKAATDKPFPQESELTKKLQRSSELIAKLELNDKSENGAVKEVKKESIRDKIKQNLKTIKNRDDQKELLSRETPAKEITSN